MKVETIPAKGLIARQIEGRMHMEILSPNGFPPPPDIVFLLDLPLASLEMRHMKAGTNLGSMGRG